MEKIYTGEATPKSLKKSIFLAGPTPRSPNVKSWRPEALKILEQTGYDGVVFVPEFRERGNYQEHYDDYINWEHDGLNMADCILFWVPRKLKTMPAFTTNVEFGLFCRSGKVVLGAPKNAVKTEYLKNVAGKCLIPQFTSLKDTVDATLKVISDGAERRGGEIKVPLHIWRTRSFQNWYQAQKAAGNRLDNAKLEWIYKVGPNKEFVYLWALHVDVYITKEDRHKVNEVVISRPNISTVVMYRKASELYDSEVVLIREFRSPASTPDGCIWENPGGSSFSGQQDPQVIAADEVYEETGLKLSPERLRCHQSRQLMGTLSAHKADLYSAELTDEEMDWMKNQKGIAHGLDAGKKNSGEQTFIEVCTLREIMEKNLSDWSTIGMILSVLKPAN